MRSTIFRLAPVVLTYFFTLTTYAADELSVYVFKDGNAATGLEVLLDGNTSKLVDEDGSAFFDLKAGGHVLSVQDDDKVLFSQDFNSARGQYVDFSVALRWGTDPQATLNKWFATESPAERALGPTGILLGRITLDGEPLADMQVAVKGLDVTTRTDIDGNYRMVLPRGIYSLVIEDEDLGVQQIDGLRVVANIERGANFAITTPDIDEGMASQLDIQRPQIEEIFAIAKFKPTAAGESERYSSTVVDTMGIAELSRYGGSDIAQSIIRVPSVTVKDGRFIFIRGLGGRYITTTLNGALLPSTDPAKRTVPLDLFPSNFVSQLDVKKTFIASMPGESTGGNLVINTRTFPAESEGKISVQTSYTEGLTGKSVYGDPVDGSFDAMGFDDGSRSKAAPFRAISDVLNNPTVASQLNSSQQVQLNQAGALLLKDNLLPETTTANPNAVIGVSYGNVFDLDGGESEFGFLLAGNYRNIWNQQVDGVQRTYSGDANSGTVEVEDDFDFQQYSNDVESSAMLNLGLNAGNNGFGANTLISRVTESRTWQQFGEDGDEQIGSARFVVDWVERQFLSQQFTGNHVLGEQERWIVDWQVTASRAERDAPDRREVRFDLDGADGIYNLEVPFVTRRYDELTDNNIDLTADIEYMLDTPSSIETTLSFGGQYIYRDRDSDSETYGFTGGQLLDDNAPNLAVSDVINESTITGDPSTGYAFQDKTLASDSYEAEMNLNAVYVSLDTLQNDTYQTVLGLRYEDYQQTTDTFDLADSGAAVTSKLDEGVLLPAINFNWFMTDNQTLRLGASQTVSRPDFKETSLAVFYDPDFDIRVRGNPNLEVSDVTNLDVRYQFFWDDVDSWSIGAFYKDIDKPIERVVLPASGTAGNSRRFENADRADVYGIELEGRKEWGFGSGMAQSFFISGNVSLIESEVEQLGQDTRALQGQPEYVINLILGFDDVSHDQEVTLLLNQNGDTITDAGVSGQPDIILEPRLDLGLNYRWYFTTDWQFVFRGENLLDADVEYTQGGNIFRKYRTGRQFTVGLNWNF